MSDQSWKQWEREVATDLGGERTGPRGFAVPDVVGLDDVGVECKYTRNGWPNKSKWSKWMTQAKHNSEVNGYSWWGIFLCLGGGKGTKQEKYVLIPYDYFVELYMKGN